jgi:hypothetical protein
MRLPRGLDAKAGQQECLYLRAEHYLRRRQGERRQMRLSEGHDRHIDWKQCLCLHQVVIRRIA